MDNLERFLELREALQAEQSEILRRLEEIEKALGSASNPGRDTAELGEQKKNSRRGMGRLATAGRASTPSKAGRTATLTKRDGSRRNKKSLKDAVLEVLGSGRKTRQEILEAVQKSGYQFTTSNPLNSLGVILYGKKPKFRNENGYFSVA